MSETSRRSKASPLKDVIEEFLQVFDLQKKYNETYLPAFWEKIMGKYIASRTTTIYVSERKLFLKISSAPLRQELFMAKTKLIDLVNKEIGKTTIEDVVFL